MNTTEAYWAVDDQSLQTLAYNIETLGGRDEPPSLRGSDLIIPGRVGEIWQPKTVGSRIIPLAMWVRGAEDDGTVPSNWSDRRSLFDQNWRMLRNLLWQENRQFELSKRIMVDGQLRKVVAKAQFNAGLTRTMSPGDLAKFTVDLKLTDPYFYDENYTSRPLNNGANEITIGGDARTSKIIVNVSGARTNPRILNDTLDIDFTYAGQVLTGASLRADIDAFNATITANSVTSKDNSKISHSGDRYWLLLRPGSNSIVLSSSAGTGSVNLQVKAAWL